MAVPMMIFLRDWNKNSCVHVGLKCTQLFLYRSLNQSAPYHSGWVVTVIYCPVKGCGNVISTQVRHWAVSPRESE